MLMIYDATTLKLGDDIWYNLKRPIWSKVRTQGMHPVWYKTMENVWPWPNTFG
jgi:hypothetical protein